jgi:hypothetical protein
LPCTSLSVTGPLAHGSERRARRRPGVHRDRADSQSQALGWVGPPVSEPLTTAR